MLGNWFRQLPRAAKHARRRPTPHNLRLQPHWEVSGHGRVHNATAGLQRQGDLPRHHEVVDASAGANQASGATPLSCNEYASEACQKP
eukprot:1441968-Alexandrium_andersonii.AAC.1